MVRLLAEARQVIRDAAMRRALLEMLQEATKDHRPGHDKGVPMPEPTMDDDRVKNELDRILGIKRWPWQ